ncbi:MAG: hypothetical protein H7069_07890 [Phormidesmis sp. FL-bin-119]|nr:hypothetical protein [Pedobacter sp.]
MRKVSVLFYFLLITVSSFAQVLSSQQIDSLVEKAMIVFNVPGIAVAVIKDGKVGIMDKIVGKNRSNLY